MIHQEDDRREYASPPWFMHELDPAYSGLPAGDHQAAIDVARWRKAERARIIAERLAVPAATRSDASSQISKRLDRLVGDLEGRTVGIYWPFRGEPDLSGWGGEAITRGVRLALPVVLAKEQPLEFRT